MANKFNQTDTISFFWLKVMYFYATAFGVLLFTVTIGDKPRVRYSIRIKYISIGFRISCLILYIICLPAEIKKLIQLTSHITLSNFETFVFVIKFISITGFTIFLLFFHALHFNQWVKLINRAINVMVRIMKLRQNHKFFTVDFYMIVICRFAFTLHVFALNAPQLFIEVRHKNYLLVMQWLSEIYLWIGTVIVVDGCYVCYVAFADMYKNITDFLFDFEAYFDEACLQNLSRSRRRRLFRSFCEQLEECTLIYSEIHNVICGFQKSFQFIICFTFYIDFVSIIILLHLSIWVFLKKGQILTYLLIMSLIKTFEIVTLIFMADRIVKNSEIPKHLNWENMCVDMHKHWNRTVEQFLSLLKFQHLRMDIFGLYQLNNSLSLRFLSLVVTYLTVLVQFTLMGYFHEADYNFLNTTVLT